jgi:predicted metal-dependent hydrolase
MTAQTVTRDEFEDVKQLLASAARYAESANARLDRVAAQQELNTNVIALLGQKIDALTTAQQRTQQQLDALTTEVSEMRVLMEASFQQAEQDRSQAAFDRAEFRTTVTQLLEVLTRQFNGNGHSGE